MNRQFSRTEKLIGSESMKRLRSAHILVFGVGGVGSSAAEALARSGVGHIELVDADVVDITNLNRQIMTDHSNIGLPKVEVMAKRIRQISPETKVTETRLFFLPEKEDKETFDWKSYDLVIDAVDTVAAKLSIAEQCEKAGVLLISSMGTAGKLHPEKLQIADIYKTQSDPLAKAVRKEFRKRGLSGIPVVYSTEKVYKAKGVTEGLDKDEGLGTMSFVPPVAGYLMAGYAIRKIAGIENSF